MSPITSTKFQVIGPAGKRLIDQDPNVFILFKKVIVLGDPNAVTHSISEALKLAGLSVYDADAASANHVRDFHLWNEALQAKLDGKPFGRKEFDKLTGRYNAIVGGPATLFADDLLRAYPDCKVILIDGFQQLTFLKVLGGLDNEIAKSIGNWIDPSFFGAVSTFSGHFQEALAASESTMVGTMVGTISTVPEKKLLKIQSVGPWDPICKFLEIQAPAVSFPSMPGNMLQKQASCRIRHIASMALCTIAFGLLLMVMTMAVGLAGFIIASRILALPTLPATLVGILAFGTCLATKVSLFANEDPSKKIVPHAPKSRT